MPTRHHAEDSTKGLGGLARRLKYQMVYKNALAGRLVEWRGNQAKVRGMTFSLNNPAISRGLKGRFIFGVWEKHEVDLVARYIDPDQPVIELGACIGVISCLSNRILRNRSQHVVVEANPRLIETLKANRDRNECEFDVVHAALGYHAAVIPFYLDELAVGGSLHRPEGEPVEVPTVSLQDLLRRPSLPPEKPVTLIVDVEGSEKELIEEELDVLRERVALLWLETHPQILPAKVIEALQRRLADAGFTVIHQIKDQYLMENTAFARPSAPPVSTERGK